MGFVPPEFDYEKIVLILDEIIFSHLASFKNISKKNRSFLNGFQSLSPLERDLG